MGGKHLPPPFLQPSPPPTHSLNTDDTSGKKLALVAAMEGAYERAQKHS